MTKRIKQSPVSPHGGRRARRRPSKAPSQTFLGKLTRDKPLWDLVLVLVLVLTALTARTLLSTRVTTTCTSIMHRQSGEDDTSRVAPNPSRMMHPAIRYQSSCRRAVPWSPAGKLRGKSTHLTRESLPASLSLGLSAESCPS